MLRVTTWISFDFGLPIPFLKMKPSNYGFGILTNVSAFGITDCTAPWFRFASPYSSPS